MESNKKSQRAERKVGQARLGEAICYDSLSNQTIFKQYSSTHKLSHYHRMILSIITAIIIKRLTETTIATHASM